MAEPGVSERMRHDWNQRAREDPYYYVAFGRREQDHQEFFASGSDVVRGLQLEFRRLRARDAALEIGCGPGRLLRPLAAHFREIHGVDVSDEMVRLAEQRLAGFANAHAHHTSGSDLSLFPDGKFDFVYSYAVFQHIPSRDVVFGYLSEALRVLKPSGVLRCQLNGLPPQAKQYDTWSGVRITAEEIRRFARDSDCQLLAVEGVWTQYMWITCRKMPRGWTASLQSARPALGSVVRSISNALTGEAVVPARGELAAMSLWIAGLSGDCDLNHLEVTAEGSPCRLIYLGEPERDALVQLNAALPDSVRTGLVPVEVSWLGRPLCATAWVRIIPPGPLVSRIVALSDGVNLLSGPCVASRTVKLTMAGVQRPREFHAAIDGVAADDPDSFCTDPLAHRYEFNFRLPEAIQPGPHTLEIALAKRRFAAIPIEVT